MRSVRNVRTGCVWTRPTPKCAPLWATCLARSGQKDKAREEFARIEALQPPDLDKLRDLFADQMRRQP